MKPIIYAAIPVKIGENINNLRRKVLAIFMFDRQTYR